MLSKIHGCLAGLALGDALGMPSEFLTPLEIRQYFGWIEAFQAAPGFHPHAILFPGQITDDTGQALAIAHACQPAGEITAAAAARHLLAWEDGCKQEILAVIEGPSTRAALKAIRMGADPRNSGKDGRTNGAAMRAAAPGLLNAGDSAGAVRDAYEASLPTHGTGVAISGAAAVACAVAEACQPGASLESILHAGRAGADAGARLGAWGWSTPLSGRIDLAARLAAESPDQGQALRDIHQYVGTDMLVPESVAAAFGVVLLAGGDPMKAVCLGANIGGDTDTIAAVAGQICGALAGIEAIDRDMVKNLEEVNGISLEEEAELIEDMIQRRRKAGI